MKRLGFHIVLLVIALITTACGVTPTGPIINPPLTPCVTITGATVTHNGPNYTWTLSLQNNGGDGYYSVKAQWVSKEAPPRTFTDGERRSGIYAGFMKAGESKNQMLWSSEPWDFFSKPLAEVTFTVESYTNNAWVQTGSKEVVLQ
jgi:hypothetical protein